MQLPKISFLGHEGFYKREITLKAKGLLLLTLNMFELVDVKFGISFSENDFQKLHKVSKLLSFF